MDRLEESNGAGFGFLDDDNDNEEMEDDDNVISEGIKKG